MNKEMKYVTKIGALLLCLMLFCVFTVPVQGASKNEKKPAKSGQSAAKTVSSPKEYGAYIKTNKGYIRLLPNIVFDENNIFYIEPNNPAHFYLKDVEYFVLYGPHDYSVLTINPMGMIPPSPVGKIRAAFGKAVNFDLKQQGKPGKEMYIVRPKEILARGYYSLWINDTAWDFLLD
ncbi:MAG: hypothetical protein ACYDHW_12415 [Syntrophorhabdaceae bacterium]